MKTRHTCFKTALAWQIYCYHTRAVVAQVDEWEMLSPNLQAKYLEKADEMAASFSAEKRASYMKKHKEVA